MLLDGFTREEFGFSELEMLNLGPDIHKLKGPEGKTTREHRI